MSVRYRFIRGHAREHAVRTLCRVLQVSRAGYYAWQQRQQQPQPRRRAAQDAGLLAAIRTIYQRSRRTYGSPRIHRELQGQGQRHGRKRVARLMRTAGLRAKAPRRWRPTTTQAASTYPVAPNTLARQFAGHAPQRVWVGDITYLPTREGWLYLAVVLDLGSRRVIGWAMQATLDGQLTLDALAMALAQRRPAAGRPWLHHSDRGRQYTAHAYRAALAAAGIRCSMSRRGNCWDNAVSESFFATLKRELVDGAAWATRAAARQAVFEYLEVWYNRQRRHSSLGYLSPAAYEQQHGAA